MHLYNIFILNLDKLMRALNISIILLSAMLIQAKLTATEAKTLKAKAWVVIDPCPEHRLDSRLSGRMGKLSVQNNIFPKNACYSNGARQRRKYPAAITS